MRAPSNRRSDKEIIDAIIKEAGDRSVAPQVKRRIDDLRELPPPFPGSQRDNANYLKDLSKLIDKLKKKLTTAPWPLSVAVTDAGLFDRLFDAKYTAIWINSRTRLIAQRPSGRTSLLAILDGLRTRCDRLRESGLGIHGHHDYRKLGAAIAARELLEHIASMTGKKLSLSCRRESKFCEIATLFFEAMTGKHAADLRRACEHVAAPVRTKR
jgi:hypothetical protein